MRLTEEAREGLTRAGLNLIQQALSIFDSDLRLAVCNQRFQDMFDFPDELVTPGAAFEDVIRFQVRRGEYGTFSDPEEAVQVRVRAARAFVPHYMERQRPNQRWISVEGAPLAHGGWVTVYTDITEVKMQEGLLRARSEELSGKLLAHAERLAQTNRQLAATNAALAEAKRELTGMEARTRLTTEMMPAHIAHVGRDLRYTYSNRRLSAVLPGRPSDILGLTGLEALGATNFAKILPALHKALAGEASVVEFSDDETGRRIRGAFTPDQIGEGPINGVYILSTDVTEEAQARAALTQTRKRELAVQLTSGLAHDFSNLLTIILGLQSRLQRLDLPQGAQDMVAGTLAAARRGGVLLDRIASISGRRELRPVAVEIAGFADEIGVLARAALPQGSDLEILVDAFPDPVMLDPGMVQDALVNLVLNARDAMAPAGGRIEVRIRRLRDIWVEFAVLDEGPGFSPEALERGLDPFFTTKGGEGSGLGLAMVYDQSQLAGGSVRLANRPEGGAQVTLRLPLRTGTMTVPAGLVLLVEDSEEIRQSVRLMLQGMGHAVIEAASAEEAEALAGLPGLVLVLSDINLQGAATGIDLARSLAERLPEVPVALMTALPLGDPRRARAEARYPILQKPFEATALSAFLGRLPGRSP